MAFCSIRVPGTSADTLWVGEGRRENHQGGSPTDASTPFNPFNRSTLDTIITSVVVSGTLDVVDMVHRYLYNTTVQSQQSDLASLRSWVHCYMVHLRANSKEYFRQRSTI